MDLSPAPLNLPFPRKNLIGLNGKKKKEDFGEFALYTAFDRLYDKWKKAFDKKNEINELKVEIVKLQKNQSDISKILYQRETDSLFPPEYQHQKDIKPQKVKKKPKKRRRGRDGKF